MKNKPQKPATGNEYHCGTNQESKTTGGTLTSASGAGVGNPKRNPSTVGARAAHPSGRCLGSSPGEAHDPGGAAPAREIRLTFTPEQWAEIEACAAFDEMAPEQWAEESIYCAITDSKETMTRRRAEESGQRSKLEAFRRRTIVIQELGFSPDEAAAITICGLWEGGDFESFCRDAALSQLEASFADMEGFATGKEGFRDCGRAEMHFAKRHYNFAASIMARLGWNGICIDSPKTRKAKP